MPKIATDCTSFRLDMCFPSVPIESYSVTPRHATSSNLNTIVTGHQANKTYDSACRDRHSLTDIFLMTLEVKQAALWNPEPVTISPRSDMLTPRE